MRTHYRPYPEPRPNPYDQPLGPAPLRVRLRIRLDRIDRAARRLSNWFFDELDWRRIDRVAVEFLSFALAAVAIYVVGLVAYCVAFILHNRGGWPTW